MGQEQNQLGQSRVACLPPCIPGEAGAGRPIATYGPSRSMAEHERRPTQMDILLNGNSAGPAREFGLRSEE